MRRAPARPKLYFSFRSPYSWMRSRSCAAACRTVLAVQWVPYWDPDEALAALAPGRREFHYSR